MASRRYFEELPSTQRTALALARSGAEDGTRVVARLQTHGEGRRGRRWISPEGGLYLSIVCRAPRAGGSLFPLAIGDALARAFTTAFGIAVRPKWPNDLVVAEGGPARKVAGILLDRVPSPSLGTAVVVGVGTNVAIPRSVLPDAVARRIANLSEGRAPTPSLSEVERLVVEAVARARADLDAVDGPARVRAALEGSLYGFGRRVRLDGATEGIAHRLGPEGELYLATNQGEVAVWAGNLEWEGVA